MERFAKLFSNVRNNDVKSINKSIENVGRKHHAVYMADMMFGDDISMNYQLLMKIQDVVNSFYKSVNENYLIKTNACNVLEVLWENKIAFP